ncbi:MAG: hypothetical protein UZ15_CFX003001137 [Chloroflexi bacterium OLB15]|nr:MAG: hypothetical protein UZ15_CFX003001137 [Chloroflexi bacterium OLB15]
MPANNYHFITHWRIKANLREVVDVLGNAEDLPRWWPSVYLEVKQLTPGDEAGIGRRVSLYTKGWLPYTLRWSFTVTDVRDDGFTLTADGDFVGRGIWTFVQDGDYTEAIYDWKIEATKPILRDYSWIMKPIFGMNHKWAMARGQESLIIELMRRKATTDDEKRNIPTPPPATPNAPGKWMLAVLGFSR